MDNFQNELLVLPVRVSGSLYSCITVFKINFNSVRTVNCFIGPITQNDT